MFKGVIYMYTFDQGLTLDNKKKEKKQEEKRARETRSKSMKN